MRRISLCFLMFLSAIAGFAQTDSLGVELLPEAVINIDGQIETAEKTVLLPTAIEKKHATNGFDLLSVMQVAELNVSPRTQSITSHAGREIVLCVNGVEVLPEDVATLRSKNIRSIEYIRTPTGKYAGKAGLLNFVTVKLEYGGNVYLSASEGFVYKNGAYLLFSDFTKKGTTLSLIASGDWASDRSFSEGRENFVFADNSTLTRAFTSKSSLNQSNNEAARFRLTSMGENHRLNAYVSFACQAVPTQKSVMNSWYTGRYVESTERVTSSKNKGLAPSIYANYTHWLPKAQALDFTLFASLGHNKYSSLYDENNQSSLSSAVKEKNHSIHANAGYYKSWESGLMFVASLVHDHNCYKDAYTGSSSGNQRLTTDVTMGLLQLSGSTQKCYFSFSAGVSNSAVSLNDADYNYCVPVAFYSGNYAISQQHALSFNGLFTHTLFDPSNKNDMTLPTSFFEAVKGNPDLAPLKVLANTLSYNGQVGKSKFSLSYKSNIYFDNILHLFSANNSTIFDTRVNDGNFYGNMLVASYSYSAFSDKLRLSLTAMEEYNILHGDTYNLSRNIFRLEASVACLIGDWMLKMNYNTPYMSLDIREPYFIRRRAVYEWLVNWNYKNWSVEALVRNPFSRYDRQHITMDYGAFRRDSWNQSAPDGCNLNLKLTYSFGYGKKVERGNFEINKQVNSAIMKAAKR